MKWYQRLRIWWAERMSNGAIQAMVWQEDIVRKGEDVILGKKKD